MHIRLGHTLQEQDEKLHTAGGLAFVCFGRKKGENVVESEADHRCTGLQVSTMDLYNCRNSANRVSRQ